ncbi:MAG: glucosaminidase domain-containing protein [Bacteroidota bacterium]
MTSFLSTLVTFVARHWLRLLIAVFALVLFTRKQVNLNVRLGAPTPTVTPTKPLNPAPAEAASLLSDATPAPEKPGFFERFNLFGGSDEPDYFTQLSRVDEREVANFLRRFSNVAQAEQEKFGIPASITLGVALLYGKAGQHPAARDHNAYFALPCGADWPGTTAQVNGACLRTYTTAWTGFRDFSLYLTSGKYTALGQFNSTDYQRWAAGLEELGFNATEDLAGQLLRTVDKYQLFRFD